MLIECRKCRRQELWPAVKGSSLKGVKCAACRGQMGLVPCVPCAECNRRTREPRRPRFSWKAMDRYTKQMGMHVHAAGTPCCWRHEPVKEDECLLNR